MTTANDRVLWAGLPGSLSLIARKGDVIDLDLGPGLLLKNIAGIGFGDGDATPGFPVIYQSASAAFNDAGQIAWSAQFTDGTTAVFLTTVPSGVPEPATLILLLVPALIGFFRRVRIA